MDNPWLVKIILFFKPIVMWIDKWLSIPHIVKKVNGNEFYQWYPILKKGMVFISDTRGHGSNLINPSNGKHGAIYFGLGLKTEIDSVVSHLIEVLNVEPDSSSKAVIEAKIKRLSEASKKVSDSIPYVIEAVGQGVIANDLVSFLTSKDRVRGLEVNKAIGVLDAELIMSISAEQAVNDLGLAYDYGFANSDTEKYCFETVVDAYKSTCKDIDLKPKVVLHQDFYDAESFWNSKDFTLVLDSDKV